MIGWVKLEFLCWDWNEYVYVIEPNYRDMVIFDLLLMYVYGREEAKEKKVLRKQEKLFKFKQAPKRPQHCPFVDYKTKRNPM